MYDRSAAAKVARVSTVSLQVYLSQQDYAYDANEILCIPEKFADINYHFGELI